MNINNQYPTPALKTLVMLTTSFSVVNSYGPFAVMTKTRPEIIITGSNDGINWKTYAFKYKPDDLFKHLSWNIPHQPRLDWQMWFAALTPPGKLYWFNNFMHRLKSGSPTVLALLAHNPFPDNPPAIVRAHVYQYEYTSLKQRSENAQLWVKQYQGKYWP
jgi:hypothetical protein